MLRPLEERLELARTVHTLPYVDPVIKRDVVSLAARMATAGMLRGVVSCRSTVGMFTVVKKVLPEDEMAPDGTVHRKAGSIVLRLVLDQRVPNLSWREPPWVGQGPAMGKLKGVS